MNALRTTAIAAAIVAGSALAANAATMLYATDATIVTDGPRGTNDDRANIANALGSEVGDFFELGYGAVVDFTFGRLFTGPGHVLEVTFSVPPKWVESVQIQAGRGGVFTDVATISNAQAQFEPGARFDLAGAYDTLRLIDTSPVRENAPTGGFDVDYVSVAAVPLPAAGLMLLGALGGLALFRRRG